MVSCVRCCCQVRQDEESWPWAPAKCPSLLVQFHCSVGDEIPDGSGVKREREERNWRPQVVGVLL